MGGCLITCRRCGEAAWNASAQTNVVRRDPRSRPLKNTGGFTNEQICYRDQKSHQTVRRSEKRRQSEHSCTAGQNLRAAGKKRSREDHYHENASGTDPADSG